MLVGVTHDDGSAEVAWMARKIAGVRLLAGEQSVTLTSTRRERAFPAENGLAERHFGHFVLTRHDYPA